MFQELQDGWITQAVTGLWLVLLSTKTPVLLAMLWALS
jgi:hypothetical protein